MIKKIFAMAAGALASYAAAASAVVWTAADGSGDVPLFGGWYVYPKTATSTTSGTLTTNDDGEKVLTAKVSLTSDASAAGIGFGIAKEGATKDLSAYQGVCLTYSALKPFKFDVKQGNIDDSNFNGINMPAHAKMDTAFVPFSKLAQEDWGDATVAVAFDAALVNGFQFSYKKSIAAEAKNATNTVTISAVTLGSSCTNHAPKLTTEFADHDGKSIAIAEGGLHTIDMSKVFTDEDGDDLTITVAIDGESVELVDSAAYNQSSVIKFTTMANPKENAGVVITATDPTKKTATFSFTFTTEDVDNDPVAQSFAIEVPEDSSYKNGLTAKSNNLKSMGSDADGDKINLVIVDEPEHGELTVDVSTGIFTYTPDKDYNGKDSFTYKFVDAKNEASESNLGTCTITVTPVNDPAVVTVVAKTFQDDAGKEYAFGDTLVVDEDFASFSILVPSANITVTDVDGEDDIVIEAKSSGVLSAKYTAVEDFYGIEISAVKDANGVAKVSLAVGDKKLAEPIDICYVKVNAVADAPVAKDDEYKVVQDSLNKIAAKKGVLANDANPDSVEVTAILVAEAANGTVELAEDGSFTYESKAGYEGEDAFGYKIVYGKDTTEMAVVTLNVVYKNKAPQIVEGVIDTVGKRLSALTEDFSTAKKYSVAEMRSWFTDDADKPADLKFTASTKDSLTNPSITSAGVLQIAAVKNACGEAEVILTATDKQGASTDLIIPAVIACSNDKPVLTTLVDTIYIGSKDWSGVYDLTKVVSDPDGDTLTYTVSDNIAFRRDMSFELKGDSILLKILDDSELNDGDVRSLSVKAADAETYVTFKIQMIVGEAPAVKDSSDSDSTKTDSTGIAPVMASAKLNWQGAIQANRGTVSMMDMQGRVLWIRRLPVSESEVRAAAASVQGRKILRVNHQTWTIK